MTPALTGLYRIDSTNIGDYYSSPLQYFEFPNRTITEKEIQSVDADDIRGADVIVGGGGLLDRFFLPSFTRINAAKTNEKLIAWGCGQQLDREVWWKSFRSFPYGKFLEKFDLVGVRDDLPGTNWVPCASCMHESFDKPRDIKHEYVIFSHKSHIIPIDGFPSMSNEPVDLEETLDFLGSGETVITSSYHGMYWATLLNRRVLVFPFNSKFFPFKYPVTFYPAGWKRKGVVHRKIRSAGGKKLRQFYCPTVSGWRILAGSCRSFPQALDECRSSNRAFHAKVLDLLGD